MARPPAVGDLAITELLINPAGTDTGREWIEISNQAAHAVDLANIHVADAINDAPIDFAILAGGPPILPAAARAVLIQSPDATKNGGLTLGGGGLVLVGGAFGTRVSLNNGGDTISVCAGPCAEGVVLDRVAWDAALGATYEGHALSIDDHGRRCPATAAFGDAGSFGTPGAPNPLCP
jgi:Lamin Tail Domain